MFPNALLAGVNKDLMHQVGLPELSRDKECQSHEVMSAERRYFKSIYGV